MSEPKVKGSHKVKPAEEKLELRSYRKDKSLAEKASTLLMRHPELTRNARGYFRNENGRTIVEETVPRGDLQVEDVIYPRNQDDLTDKDLKSIVVLASSMVDEGILKYDKNVAYEDALNKAIWNDGKYAGKINASTFCLLLENMGKSKKAFDLSPPVQEMKQERKRERLHVDQIPPAEDEIPTEQSEKDKFDVGPGKALELSEPQQETVEKALKGEGGIGAGKKHVHRSDIEKMRKKIEKDEPVAEKPTEEEPADKPMEGEMDKEAVRKQIEEMEAKLASLKDALAPTPAPEKKEEQDKYASKENIVSALDEIAGMLESQEDPELTKMAFEIDQVSDVLDGKKTASVIKQDGDEGYMKGRFQDGLEAGDADEKKYMTAFDVDKSAEVSKLRKGLTGASLPYQVKK